MMGNVGVKHLRKDKNHKEIVAVFKKLRWSVADLSSVGAGIPDILIGDRSHGTHFVEIKSQHTSYGRKGLTKRQQEWADIWRGKVHVVRTIDDAIALTKTLTAGRMTGDGGAFKVTTLSRVEDVAKLDRGEL